MFFLFFLHFLEQHNLQQEVHATAEHGKIRVRSTLSIMTVGRMNKGCSPRRKLWLQACSICHAGRLIRYESDSSDKLLLKQNGEQSGKTKRSWITVGSRVPFKSCYHLSLTLLLPGWGQAKVTHGSGRFRMEVFVTWIVWEEKASLPHLKQPERNFKRLCSEKEPITTAEISMSPVFLIYTKDKPYLKKKYQ